MLLAEPLQGAEGGGVEVISGDYEGRGARTAGRWRSWRRPTRRPASCGCAGCRRRRSTASSTPRSTTRNTKDRRMAVGQGSAPGGRGADRQALDRAFAFYQTGSLDSRCPGGGGPEGSDFIKGWKRREDPLDIGFVDEASMLDERQFDDLREIFPDAGAVRRPGAAGPGRPVGEMVFDKLAPARKLHLHRIHRQAARQPDPRPGPCAGRRTGWVRGLRADGQAAARRDDRVVWAERVDADLMARSPGAGLAQ
jgi:exodeoxyribonuclease-5